MRAFRSGMLQILVVALLLAAGCRTPTTGPRESHPEPSAAAVDPASDTPDLDTQIARVRAAHAADPAALWPALVDLVEPGMRRAQVERILPAYLGSPVMTTTQGAGQAVFYQLDPQWTVCVPYDYTGCPQDAAGRLLAHESPLNRATSRPTLRPPSLPPLFRPIGPVAIETVEVTGPADHGRGD